MDFFRIAARESNTRYEQEYSTSVTFASRKFLLRLGGEKFPRADPDLNSISYCDKKKSRVPCVKPNGRDNCTRGSRVRGTVFTSKMSREQDRPFSNGIEIRVSFFTVSKSKSSCCGAFATNFECVQGDNRSDFK